MRIHGLGSFFNFAGLDATGTDLNSTGAALRELHTDRLHVRIKTPRRSIVSMGYIVPELWAFAAYFATFSH